jgi:1-acyl-sn-glycerol-3-phosphate acyltransferase
VLKAMNDAVLDTLSELQILGEENPPERGPLMVVANHFRLIDAMAMIRTCPWPIEFLGGFQMPNAPGIFTWVPRLWGYHRVHGGTASCNALRAAAAALAQGGVLGINCCVGDPK